AVMAQHDEADKGAVSSVLDRPPAISPALPALTDPVDQQGGFLKRFHRARHAEAGARFESESGYRRGATQILEAVSALRVSSRSPARRRTVRPTSSTSTILTRARGTRRRWCRYWRRGGASRCATSEMRVMIPVSPARSKESGR